MVCSFLCLFIDFVIALPKVIFKRYVIKKCQRQEFILNKYCRYYHLYRPTIALTFLYLAKSEVRQKETMLNNKLLLCYALHLNGKIM